MFLIEKDNRVLLRRAMWDTDLLLVFVPTAKLITLKCIRIRSLDRVRSPTVKAHKSREKYELVTDS